MFNVGQVFIQNTTTNIYQLSFGTHIVHVFVLKQFCVFNFFFYLPVIN